MGFLEQNIEGILKTIPTNVKLVAVSKTKPVSDIIDAWNSGLRCFGENRVQELVQKNEEIQLPVEWHYIGHLQTNKVKYIVPFVSMIQSVDSFKLLKEINKEALKADKVVDCLLQVYIAKEESKFGFSVEELHELYRSHDYKVLYNVRVIGVMGMATFTENMDQVRNEFRNLKETFLLLKNEYNINNDAFREISMGMSGDYQIAIEEGSTIVRIGSLMFGER